MCSSCGFFNQYCTHQPSMFWENNATQYQNYSSSNYNNNYDYNNDSTDNYSSSSPNSVDCTLSLGTPSTRFITPENINDNSKPAPTPTPHRKSVSSFCWDLLSSGKQSSSAATKPHRHHSNAGSSTGDSLLTRRCANCDTTSTPLWRNGPRGPKSLCNACGIRYKKEERRAAAAAATVAAQNSGGGGMMMVEPQWAHQYPQGTPQKMQYMGAPNEYRFMDDDHRSSGDSGVQFLSWLTYDRPSGLVHDFTR